MIPSVLGAQVRRGIAEFLRTTFPITNPWFANSLDNLLNADGQIFRGPYVSLKLPFTRSDSGRMFFPGVVPGDFHPHAHQEAAWERLDWRSGWSTVVATGTGSGKTECFLFPILDYCLAHARRPDIKAILIYPMNALAADQAKRFANTIYRNENLRGRITAGLYLGEQEKEPSTGMTETRLITSRPAMRERPPDILLTNYKMLDYLLLRQKDLGLWSKNDPETLRYLVVDELHTFDGAQGGDVACLIRRLKQRLRTPERHLICVGTSATLGASGKLTEYAEKVFGEQFAEDSIIGETVQKSGEFFRGYGIEYAGVPGPEAKSRLNPLAYEWVDEYLTAQRRLWGLPADMPLVQTLRQHGFFFGTDTLRGTSKVVQRSRFSFFREAQIWYSRDPEQYPISEQFENVIVLSDEFYREIDAHRIPADLEAVKVLTTAPAVLDLFMWLSYRCFVAKAKEMIPLFGPFGLASQIGSIEYARPRRFREKLEGWLETIRVLWPECSAKISSDGTGLEVNRATAILVEQKARG